MVEREADAPDRIGGLVSTAKDRAPPNVQPQTLSAASHLVTADNSHAEDA
jgi:hypothetical protein